MSDDHLDLGQELHRRLVRERSRTGGPRRWRCSVALRARVVAYAATCLGNGESHGSIATRLGIAEPTLSHWIREASENEAGFRPVAIIPEERPVAEPPTTPLRLITPRGFVVEGLGAELLASLLQVLG